MNMDWKSVVKTVAPTIGSALLGPMGGNAVKFLADKFLGDSNATEEQIANVIINITPEQRIKLQELDLQFAQLNLEESKLEYNDLSNARQREIELARTGKHDPMLYFLTVTITVGFFGVLAVPLLDDHPISQETKDILFIMVGALISDMKNVINYFFGKTKDSKEQVYTLKK